MPRNALVERASFCLFKCSWLEFGVCWKISESSERLTWLSICTTVDSTANLVSQNASASASNTECLKEGTGQPQNVKGSAKGIFS